jgi:hypothetical protein
VQYVLKIIVGSGTASQYSSGSQKNYATPCGSGSATFSKSAVVKHISVQFIKNV